MEQSTERLLDALYKLIHIQNGTTYTPYKIEDPADVITHLTNEHFLDLGSYTLEPKGFRLQLLDEEFFDKLRDLEQININAGSKYRDVLHAGIICILDYEVDITNRKYAEALYNWSDPRIFEGAQPYTQIEYLLASINTLTNSSNLTSATDSDKLERLQQTTLGVDLILHRPVSTSGFRYTEIHLQQLYDRVQYYNENRRSNSPSLPEVLADLYHINILKACEHALTETDYYTNRSQEPLLKNAISKWSSYTKTQQKNLYVRMLNLIHLSAPTDLIKSYFAYFSDNAPEEFKKLCDRTTLALTLGMRIHDADVIQMNLYDETLKPEHLPETLTNAFDA